MIAEEEAQAEEGENYFVSMTDMMVGVLFIFIIMLMTFALDFRRNSDVQEEAIRIAQEVSDKLENLQAKVQAEIERIQKVAEDRRILLQTIQRELAVEGLKVQVDDANGVLRLTEDAVLFPSGGEKLVDRSKDNVVRIARVLGRVLPLHLACRVVNGSQPCNPDAGSTVETLFIEGHTDATGGDNANWPLSTARAVNTYLELIAAAPQLKSLLNRSGVPIVSVSGYAATRPIDQRNDAKGWQINRRIDLRFVMETDNLRGLQQIGELTKEMGDEITRLRAVNWGTK